MVHQKFFLGLLTSVSLTVLILGPAGALGQHKPKTRGDVTKTVAIEKPAETILSRTSTAVPAADGFVNPQVEPGLVKWRPSFVAACEASRQSGKPVLLFQMMGKLDEQFC